MRKNQVQWWAQEGLNVEGIIADAHQEAIEHPERTVEVHFHAPFDEGGECNNKCYIISTKET